MRLSALFLRIGVFLLAAFLSVAASRAAVAVVESRSAVAVQEELVDNGHGWATVIADGLQIIIEGEAPTEAARFRAMSLAGGVVDASRVIDSMSVTDSAAMTPPEFAIEILRNDSGVSLIGLIPASTDREALAARITDIAGGQPVTDLLETADYPTPETWRPAVDYAMRALRDLPRSKISVTARRVAIDAISDSAEEKQRLETRLARNTPDGVALAVSITAPRPVIAPFITRFTLDADGARFDACTVDDDATRAEVLAAAVAAGFAGKANCIEALGQPSARWGEAAALGISAVADLGGGTVTLSDTDVSLVALEGTDPRAFDRVVGELENALPDVFALSADLPVAPDATEAGPPTFTATLSPEGLVQLRGRVPDDLVNEAAANYAMARFGQGSVTMGTRVVEGLPPGWSVRVLAGIEALSKLSNGAVIVQPDLVQITGKTGNRNADAEITALLVEKLGESALAEVAITYEEQLDPVAGLPTPEECVAQIGVVTSDRKITFDPGSATITAATQDVVDDIAEILRRCPGLRMQIAGYTDSQGREEMNQQLSQQRAQAVLDALRLRRIPVGSFEAVGFGEADPIASNETEEGREANRRIEFSLIVPEPVAEEPTTLEEIAAEGEPVAEETAEEQN